MPLLVDELSQSLAIMEVKRHALMVTHLSMMSRKKSHIKHLLPSHLVRVTLPKTLSPSKDRVDEKIYITVWLIKTPSQSELRKRLE
jgi:hypothetical protein